CTEALRLANAREPALVGVERDVVGQVRVVTPESEAERFAPIEARSDIGGSNLGKRRALALFEQTRVGRSVTPAVGGQKREPIERRNLDARARAERGAERAAPKAGDESVGGPGDRGEIAEPVVDVVREHVGAGANPRTNQAGEVKIEVAPEPE